MTAGSRLLRGARQIVARLPSPRFVRVPDAPTQPVRDPWPGDINLGVRLLKGELEFGGGVLTLRPGGWNGLNGSGPLLPPKWDFSLKPLKIGGLWLAVIITPPTACKFFTA